MDNELAASRVQLDDRHKQLTHLIQEKKAHQREVSVKNDSLIELANMELENLRLEFLNDDVT